MSNIQEITDTEKQFDLIILSGDCETWFHQEMTFTKITTLLRKAIGLLAHGGLFIFSVDNPLSKTGLFSSGPALNFLSETSGDVLRSINVNDLKEFLIAEGMANLNVLYMFPNHITPKAVFSQEAERRNLRAFGYWAATVCDVEEENNFDLISAGELSHAGRLGDLSGGVCLMATHSGCNLPEIPWQVLSLCNEQRPIVTQTITKVKTGDDLVVIKEGKSIHSPLFVFDPNKRYPVVEGCLIDAILINNILSGSLKRVINIFKKVVELWLDSFEWKQGHKTLPFLTISGDREILGDALDAIPRNLMISNGVIKFFDNEWKSLIPLPLSYLLYRSILSLLSNIKPEKIIKKLALSRLTDLKTLEDLIIFLINQMNLFSPLNQRHVVIFQQFEQRFQEFAYTGKLSDENPSLLELYQKVKASFATGDYDNLKQTMLQLEKHYKNFPEVERLSSSLYSTKQGDGKKIDTMKYTTRASIC
jgi:hypothetical protein